MNVLSLFDGISCGQIALRQAGIKYDNYFASEIDKFAIKQTQLNFPNTIQLGSVTEINVCSLPKIDLLIGGSPCQSFSFAGKRSGMSTSQHEKVYTLSRYLELKGQGFKFEGESYLFWEYIRILRDIRLYNNPDVKFLLENVEMGCKWEGVLLKAIGLFGVHINSALVSAQNRRRIYWTNIKTRKDGLFCELHSDIPQPADKGILLKDILEDKVDEKYFITSKKQLDFITDKWRIDKGYTQFNGEKALPAMARQYSSWGGDYICISSLQKHSTTSLNKSSPMVSYGNSQDKKVSPTNGKSQTMSVGHFNQPKILESKMIRRLTPTECARLQTVPGWYKWDCSETQQYKMLGNGWTVDVIAHILKFMNQ